MTSLRGSLVLGLWMAAACMYAADPADPLDPMYLPTEQAGSVPGNVWITDGMYKVHPNAPAGTQKSLKIYCAHNEYESFQVHVRADKQPIELKVEVGDFVSTTGGGTIPASSNVIVYREAYIDIKKLSDENGTPGPTPDALIPTVDPYYHEARRAFPVKVEPNKIQSTWVDVLVPETAAAGYYAATATVYDNSTVLARIPITLGVWSFGLPSTPTLKSAYGLTWDGFCIQAFGSYLKCGKYPGAKGSADTGVEMSHVAEATMFLDHRVTLSGVVYAGPTNSIWTHFDDTYGALMRGSAGTMLSGAALTSLVYTVGGALKAVELLNWYTHFKTEGWAQDLFQYTCDEPPSGCTWTEAATWNKVVHAATPDMKTLVTTNIVEATKHDLLGVNMLTPVVDEMEPQGGTNQRSTYDNWLALNTDNHLWWYQSCDEHENCSNGKPGPKTSTWPSYMIDASSVRNRVFQWLAFLDRIHGELYYLADRCFQTPCGNKDPWVSQYISGGNGDGNLIYPGTTDRIGGTTPIALPSIRLKLIRDGMEDFEYLYALSALGQDTQARQIAATFITNAYTFNNNPAALQSARVALGNALHNLAIGRN